MIEQSGQFIKELKRRMHNKHNTRKENWISIIITMLFIFGFFLIANSASFTGYATFGIMGTPEALNNTFDTTGELTGTYNVTLNATADWFYEVGNDSRNFTLITLSIPSTIPSTGARNAGSTGSPETESIKVPPPPKQPIKPIKLSIITKEEVKKIAEIVIEKPTNFQIFLFAILPIIALAITGLSLLFILIKLIKSYKKITLIIGLLALGIIVLIIPFTNEVLYWAILPLTIIIITSFTTLILINHYRKLILKTFNIKKLLAERSYIFFALLAIIITIILLARSSQFTGYVTFSSEIKNSLYSALFLIVLILGTGIYYIKKLR